MEAAMEAVWQVLVVDDEEDVHAVTKLGLKYKTWQNRKFSIVSAYSGDEAREKILAADPPFDVALVDVVMESNDSGLQLCEFIRENCPSSTRIVLRTGQPGSAPEDDVMTRYDIDYYLAKTEATEKRLFAVIRACLRSSQEISTLLTVDRQLRGLTRAIRYAPTVDELTEVMIQSMEFLATKYYCRPVLVTDLSLGERGVCYEPVLRGGQQPIDLNAVFKVFTNIHESGKDAVEVIAGPTVGMPAGSYLQALVVLEGTQEQEVKEGLRQKFFRVLTQPPGAGKPTVAAPKMVKGGLYVQFASAKPEEKMVADFFRDADRFVDNWTIAYSVLCLLQDNADERARRKKLERGG
jgi:CheY-like chemotaxis protein